MRSFEDLSDAEVLALSDEQVNRYVDLACAEAGVPLMPPLPVEPMPITLTPDVSIYIVGDFCFYNSDDAFRVAELVNSLRRCTLQYVSGPRYERVVRPAEGELIVTPSKNFSVENWDRVKNDANRYTEQKKAYDLELAEYNKTSKARTDIAESIHERRGRVLADERRRQTLRAHFERYLTLADGNREIAARFLQAAHSDAPVLLPDLFPA